MSDFRPGFRFSWLDGAFLAASAVFAGCLLTVMPLASGIVAFVVGHFFLFCNVFRIPRKPELIWAGAFSILAMLATLAGRPGWPLVFAISAALSALLVIREMRQPLYHGVGWKKINPGLENAWRQTQGDSLT